MLMSTTTDINTCWSNIDFKSAEYNIKRLQMRIAKAYINDDLVLMSYLQHKLMHSYYAKVLSIKYVSSNNGYRTPGIDNVTWMNLSDRVDAISSLKLRGYKPMPVKRIYIDKASGKKRPLGIPTLKDRAMQTLYKLAIDPIANVTADACSFAYRKGKGCRDAIAYIYKLLNRSNEFKFVLKLDIKSCFDSIDHAWLLDNIPFDKKLLSDILKCGYIENGIYHESNRGIPQGGCLSSVLCNMTLDGLEPTVLDTWQGNIRIIRYADDCLLFADNELVLVQEVLPKIKEFIGVRGLQLSEEKTMYCRLDEDTTFLGFTFNKKNETVIFQPSSRNIARYYDKLQEILLHESDSTPQFIYKKIFPIVRGWFNYYIGIVNSDTLYSMEYDTINMCNNITGNTKLAEIMNNKLFSKMSY